MKLNTDELFLVQGGSIRIIRNVIARMIRAIHIRYLMHILFED